MKQICDDKAYSSAEPRLIVISVKLSTVSQFSQYNKLRIIKLFCSTWLYIFIKDKYKQFIIFWTCL